MKDKKVMSADYKRNLNILKNSEMCFRRLFEAAQDGILILDADTGQINEVNPFLVEMLGYTRDEFLGKKLWEIGAFQDIKASREGFSQLQRKRYVRYEDLPLQAKDGHKVEVEFVSNIYKVDNKKVIQCNIRDITDRKKAEHYLDAKNKIIKKDNKKLRKNNVELSQFAATASHDLAAPLGIVTGYLKLFSKRHVRGLDTDAGHSLEKMADNLSRMQNLISSILEDSHIGQKIKFEEFDSSICYKNALLNLEAVINEKKASVTCDKFPVILGNQVLLTQVFQNLINNALKYNESSSPCVHVSSEFKDKGWIFSFRDNGIGIKPEALELIFKMFYRSHSRAQYEGTGIGLSTCKKIVIGHHGKIWVSSKLEAGSTFYFSLPQKSMLSKSRIVH